METYPFTIEYYLTETGRRPFKEWMDGLDPGTRARIRIRLDRVRLGNLGKNSHVGGGVYELKLDFGPGYRVYYALKGKTVVLLLLGGDKSTQGKDILLARAYWEGFKKRGGL